MKIMARDIMTSRFHTLHPDAPVSDAVGMFKKAGEKEGRKIFGMMVTDASDRLVGIISMYDILLYMRPKHIHIWGVMDDIDIEGLVENTCERSKKILVGDIMTCEVVTISPDTHIMTILDIMIRKHIRRLPVVEDDRILGIVYISSLFYHLLEKLIE